MCILNYILTDQMKIPQTTGSIDLCNLLWLNLYKHYPMRNNKFLKPINTYV